MPFTREQFFDVFAAYNEAVYPTQLILLAAAAVAIVLALRKGRNRSRIVVVILAVFWIWMGVVYHVVFFSRINPLAVAFGIAFILQGLVLLYVGLVRNELWFHYRHSIYGVIGALFLLYALLVYPLLGSIFGHVYPARPTFGLPCPTTIFTFGLLLWTENKIGWYLLVIPFLWSLIGFSAALTLGVQEDLGLVIAGVIGTGVLLLRDHVREETNSILRLRSM